MSKPSNKEPYKKKPFYKDEDLTLLTTKDGHMINSFVITYKGRTFTFPVRRHKILQAWKKFERKLNQLLPNEIQSIQKRKKPNAGRNVEPVPVRRVHKNRAMEATSSKGKGSSRKAKLQKTKVKPSGRYYLSRSQEEG